MCFFLAIFMLKWYYYLWIKFKIRGTVKTMKNSNEPIYDARKLGIPKMMILGIQHMFAMFGATILVPILVAG